MAETKTSKAVKYVLATGVNVPLDKRPRMERGEEVAPSDFPNQKTFDGFIKEGVIVKASSSAGKAAIADLKGDK